RSHSFLFHSFLLWNACLLRRSPQGLRWDLGTIYPVGVLARDFFNFLQEPFGQGGGLETQLEEGFIVNMQIVFGRFLTWVRHISNLSIGNLRDELCQVAHAVGLGHLVDDLDAIALCWWVFQGQLNATNHVTDVNKSARLSAGAVYGHWVTNAGLDEETVEYCAVVAVVVEAVDQTLSLDGLLRVGAPNDALVQISNAQFVVFRVVGEQMLIQHFGHMINRAGVRRVEDRLINVAAFRQVDLDVQVALGDLHARGAVAIDTHGAKVGHVGVVAGSYNGRQQVVGGVDVVVNGVALGARVFHRIWRCALFREVHDRIWALGIDEIQQAVVVLSHVDIFKANGLA